MSDIDIYDEFDAPEDSDDQEAWGPGRAAMSDMPLSLSALRGEGEDDIYVPVGQDGDLWYQVPKKIGFGKTFAVFAIWDISQKRKMAMKVPVLPVPGRGAPAQARAEHREQCDALRRETDCLLSLQQRIIAAHPSISRLDGDSVAMSSAEMGVTGVEQGADVNASRDTYGYMWNRSLKRDTRFTWVLEKGHSGGESKLPATYFMLCNVGTLEQLREKCRRDGVRIPAQFGARCMVHLFQAWTSTVGAHKIGLFQNDHAETNVFLHSPDAGKYPDCYLGDFGDAVECQLPSIKQPSSDWRKATLAYFEELVREQVLGRQLEPTARQPNDFNAKLWVKIGQELDLFLTKLKKYFVNTAPSVVNGLVERTTAQFARLVEQAAQEEPAPRVLEANFLAAVHKMKAEACGIRTFTSAQECRRKITSGALVGLPENCAPVALETERRLLGL